MKVANKDIIKEILKSKSRFFSILLITLLSTLVFVGLSTTVNDMKLNISSVFEKNNVYDLRLESVVPLTNLDKKLINKLNNIEKIVYINEHTDKDNNLYIENHNIEKGAKVLLKNSVENSKYFDMAYLSKSIPKNGKKIKNVYFENPINKLEPNVALIYLKKDKKYNLFSEEYLKLTFDTKKELQNIFESRPDSSKKEIILTINDGISKIQDGFSKISKEELKLKNGIVEINQNEKKLNDAKDIFSKNFEKIKNGEKEIAKNKAMLEENLDKVNNGLSEIEKKLPEILVGIGRIKDGYDKLEKHKNSIFLSKNKYNKYKKELDDNKAKLNSVLRTRKELLENKEKLEEGLKKISKANNELIKNKKILQKEFNNYNSTYKQNVLKINNGKQEIQDGFKKINEAKLNLDKKLSYLENTKKELIKPMYTVSSVFDNLSFSTLYNNISSMYVICLVFTSLFFLISLFIVSTTIIRFTIEQRTIIGTYKFLGYSNNTITKKFLVYALTPTIFGIILGTILGVYLVPSILYPTFFSAYINIFNNYINYAEPISIILNISLLVLVIIITIYLILNKLLKEKVIALLTSKEEKVSRFRVKNIVLRNLLKYKLRLFMTLLGIGLCTSLMYLGIGIRYAIKDVSKIQFDTVQKFDATVYFKPNVTQKEIKEYINNISRSSFVLPINTSFIKAENKYKEVFIQKVDIIDGDIDKFFNFNLKENDAVLTDSLYKVLNIEKNNNMLTYYDTYNTKYDINIKKSFENYISQFLYVKNKNSKINSVNVKYIKGHIKPNLNSNIVYSINYTSNIKKLYNKVIKSLGTVVVFMVFLGGALAIIVTYNLGNINIIERRRELATLEVLGYTQDELDSYIFREIMILAVISIGLGICLGKNLIDLVAYQFRESMQLVLGYNLNVLFLSFVLPMIFVFIVLFILRKKIKNINMIESLKVSE